MRPIVVAAVGCAHGQLCSIYDSIAHLERVSSKSVDIVLCCGDFQATRFPPDLDSMSVPLRHRKLGDFPLYYSGVRRAPKLTLFIGGNHEASAYMWEHYLGGWLAPNIFYLGSSGVVRFGDLIIGGLSGIYKGFHFNESYGVPHPSRKAEGLRYDGMDFYRGVYHVRAVELSKLATYPVPLNVLLTHDWPVHAARCGDTADLLRRKPAFRTDVEANRLGNPFVAEALRRVGRMPKLWLAAHLHVRFTAQFPEGTSFLALSKPFPPRQESVHTEFHTEFRGRGRGRGRGAAGLPSSLDFVELLTVSGSDRSAGDSVQQDPSPPSSAPAELPPPTSPASDLDDAFTVLRNCRSMAELHAASSTYINSWDDDGNPVLCLDPLWLAICVTTPGFVKPDAMLEPGGKRSYRSEAEGVADGGAEASAARAAVVRADQTASDEDEVEVGGCSAGAVAPSRCMPHWSTLVTTTVLAAVPADASGSPAGVEHQEVSGSTVPHGVSAANELWLPPGPSLEAVKLKTEMFCAAAANSKHFAGFRVPCWEALTPALIPPSAVDLEPDALQPSFTFSLSKPTGSPYYSLLQDFLELSGALPTQR